MSSKLHGEVFLRITGGDGDRSVAHLGCVLQGQVPKPAETLNSHSRTWQDVLPSQAVEDCDTRTEQWTVLCSVNIVRDLNTGFASKVCVFSIAAKSGDTVDHLILAHLEQTRLARSASAWECISARTKLKWTFRPTIVATVPCASNAFAHLPVLLAVCDCGYSANDLMTWELNE